MTAAAPASPVDRRFVARVLAVSAIVTAIILAVALPRGPLDIVRLIPARVHAPELWRVAEAGPAVQLHLLGIALAIAIGLALMIGTKGRTMHRVLGWTWVLAMATVAVSSLFIRMVNHGHFSFIHLITGWTLIALPMGVAFARTHKVKLHARTMTGLFLGGVVVAGLFAFMPGRLMWQLVFG